MEEIKLPKFICVGAAKSGTTTFHKILLSHPEIYLPLEKDFHFFDFNENYIQGIEWYKKFYYKNIEKKLSGEVSADYLYSEESPIRMKKELGKNLKIIIILREPFERAFSEYKHKKRYLKIDETITFDECFKIEKNRNFRIDPNSEMNFFSRGFYSTFIDRYEKVFSKENILLLSFDDIKSNQQKIIDIFSNFVNINSIKLKNSYKENVGKNYKYKIIQKIMHQDNLIKKIAKACIPNYKYRMKIKTLIRKINSKDDENIELLQFLNYKDIYTNEIVLLKKRGINFV
ncbi:MAG: sulfotransferase domain-containing protein [Sulfurovaceae bacterium]|nr:sulfotransferase domain-containing protein [Sulfurovaceae bacterium]